MKQFLILLALTLASMAGQTVNGITVVTTGIELTANKDAASGYAGLDGSTRLKTAQFPAFTGDATTSAGGVAITFATVNSNTGSCGDATHVCQVTLNGKGLATAAGAVAITATVSSVSGTSNQINVATGTTTPALTLSNTVIFPGVYEDKVNTVSFGATPTFDLSAGNTQKITLTGNVTSSTASNHAAGERVVFLVCQDSTGSRTFVWPTTVKGAPTIGSTLSTCTSVSFIDDGTNLYATGIGMVNM